MKKTIHFLICTSLLIGFVIISISCKKNEIKMVPKLTASVTNVQTTTAIGSGKIIDKGGEEIIVSGFCWSTNQKPTTADNKSTSAYGSFQSSFDCSITGLAPNTIYYLRGYSTNSVGTGYSDEISFTTAK
jgi:hypothetical protein